ncbi:hypothetical protein G5I_05792 [Acromyrmex echinatior]|uniref:Uncharacterized protein n=1 Tax=Acromyrmex echinatior TaxID=103372 RepID=F4WJB4_ACREC|nr:hypothetical protein G5I_05792 [Acromyrmex echinatior]
MALNSSHHSEWSNPIEDGRRKAERTVNSTSSRYLENQNRDLPFFPVSSQDHSWILTTADLVQTDASRKQRSRANIEGITPRVDGRVKQASRRGWEDQHFESRPPSCQPTSRGHLLLYTFAYGIRRTRGELRRLSISPFTRWETEGKSVVVENFLCLTDAHAYATHSAAYRKVRRDDVTSIAYEPVTRSFTNGGDEEKYDGDDDDDEDEDDEDDEDEEDVVGVRDDTHRKTRISGVDA